MSKCPICNSEAESHSPRGMDGEEINCPRCGEYQISRTAAVNWRNVLSEGGRQIANASGWIRAHQKELVNTETVLLFERLTTPTVLEKADSLLKFLAKNSKYFGDEFSISLRQAKDPLYEDNREVVPMLRLMGIAWAINGKEVVQLFDYLIQEGLLTETHSSNLTLSVSLAAKGFSYIEEQSKTNIGSNIAFCAMWFDGSMASLWDKGIEPAICNAGYQPLRIDKKEHVNRIDDEIFADIRRSRFVIADFTHDESGVRGGVYFEAGFAQGLGLPVIWTCRKDMLSEDKLHFDIRQYNFLEWTDENLEDFKDRLQKRIEAILGRGTWKPDT